MTVQSLSYHDIFRGWRAAAKQFEEREVLDRLDELLHLSEREKPPVWDEKLAQMNRAIAHISDPRRFVDYGLQSMGNQFYRFFDDRFRREMDTMLERYEGTPILSSAVRYIAEFLFADEIHHSWISEYDVLLEDMEYDERREIFERGLKRGGASGLVQKIGRLYVPTFERHTEIIFRASEEKIKLERIVKVFGSDEVACLLTAYKNTLSLDNVVNWIGDYTADNWDLRKTTAALQSPSVVETVREFDVQGKSSELFIYGMAIIASRVKNVETTDIVAKVVQNYLKRSMLANSKRGDNIVASYVVDTLARLVGFDNTEVMDQFINLQKEKSYPFYTGYEEVYKREIDTLVQRAAMSLGSELSLRFVEEHKDADLGNELEIYIGTVCVAGAFTSEISTLGRVLENITAVAQLYKGTDCFDSVMETIEERISLEMDAETTSFVTEIFRNRRLKEKITALLSIERLERTIDQLMLNHDYYLMTHDPLDDDEESKEGKIFAAKSALLGYIADITAHDKSLHNGLDAINRVLEGLQ